MRSWGIVITCSLVLCGCRGDPSSASAASSQPPGSAEAEAVAAPTPGDPPAEPETPAPVAGKLVGSGVPNGEPPADALRCTISDSNGPLEGGESTPSGCPDDAICACGAQAGYSCSGACVRDGQWVVSGPTPR